MYMWLLIAVCNGECLYVLCMAKLLSQKTFAVRVENGYSQENFHSSMLIYSLILSIDKLIASICRKNS